MRVTALVKNNSDEVKWLTIESDEADTTGYFLYYYKDTNTAFDTWFERLEDAYETAHIEYGISKDDWKQES